MVTNSDRDRINMEDCKDTRSIYVTEDIDKSANDARKYRLLTLPNKLQALLIEDEEATQSACACDVAVGSFMDPANVPGLAHFLEHMLFMGTETFPDESEYSAYLNSHGGYSNAYTTEENTVYYFSVQNDSLRSAMERFAAFFVCPLFDESCMERETMAVDSENTKNIQSDLWRQYQLLRGQAKQTHPMCQFSTGNVGTLRNGPMADGLNVRDVLLDFYHKYYSANAMKVVVYGKDKLDEMQGWVEDMFGRVENTDRDVLHVPTQPWGPSELSKMIIMKAVKDVKSLQITIPLAEQHSNYRSKPSTVLSHLIGHESAGSMLSALKNAGLANELGAHTSRQYRDFAVFQTDITLTAKGLAKPDEVLECFWAYIGMLKAEGAHDWIAEEVQHIGALEFRFREKEDPAYYASSLANNMHIYDPKDIISGAEIISEVRHDLYTSVLDRMVVENSLIFLLNQSAAAESLGQTCQWYGTEYGAHGYTEDQVNRWRDAMAGKSKWSDKIKLPQPNPFVPSDFTLQPIHVSRRSLLDADGFSRPVLLGRDRVGPCYKDELFSTAEEEAAEGLEMASLSTGEAETGEEEEKEEGGEGEGEEEEEEGEKEVEEEEGEEEIPARESQAEGEGEDVLETEAVQGGPSSDTAVSSCGRVGSTWYLQDAKWKVPRTNVTVQIQVWDAYSSPTCAVLTSLYVSVLQELVAEYSYYADCAGLYFRIYESFEGLELNVLGYSDKLNVLLEKLLDQMNGLKQAKACPAETFLRLKEQLVRVYKNKRFVQPYQRCILGMDDCMLAPRWNYEDRHAALVPITQTHFELFSRSLFDNASTRVIVAGNANPKVACEYSQSVRAKLGSAPLAFSHKPFRRSVRLEPRSQYVYRQYAVHNNPAELNSAVKNSYFISRTIGYMASSMGTGPASPETHAMRPGIIEEAKVKLLGLIISDAAFDVLRTKEQLGYIVSAYGERVGGMHCISIIVQGSVRSAAWLDKRVEAFLVTFRESLTTMSQKDFAQYVTAAIESLTMKPKNPKEELRNMTHEIAQGTYLFDRRKALALAVKQVTLEDLCAFYDRCLGAGSEHRRKFSSQFFGAKHKSPRVPDCPSMQRNVVVGEANTFKQDMMMEASTDYEDMCEVEMYLE